MYIDQTWNLITGIQFIVYDIGKTLNKELYKYVTNGNYIRLVRLAELDIPKLINDYNDCVEVKKYSEYKITDIDIVSNNINYLIQLDKFSNNTKGFKLWLKDIFSSDEQMYEHLYNKWKNVYNKNITLWFGGLDCFNKKIILSSCKQL